jgi:DNA repair protein RadC
MGITVHEHIIIGNNRFFSFADHGHINQMSQDAEALMKSD